MIFKIKGIAESLFTNWTAAAKLRYPDTLFQASNEILVDDLMDAFAKGLEFVWRNENQAKHGIPEWAVGCLLGTVSSTLNTHWSQEYIYKQTNEYKELCFLKTITQYLKIDATAIKKTESLYNHMIHKEINTAEESGKNEKIICINQFKKNKKTKNSFKSNIISYLESIYFEKHFVIFGEILKNKFTFPLADFFNTDEIMQLIASVKPTNAK